MAPIIHPSAFVDPGAELGDGVVVGPCAQIEADVVVGEGTRIDAFASVKRHTTLGRDNHIHSYALVGGEPQDLKFHGEVTRLVVGDRNNIREFSTLHRGTEGGGGVTRIGDDNLLMAYVHVAHDCVVGNGVVMSNNATLAGHCFVDDGAIIGGLSAVHQFARVGKHAFVGGMSGIAQDLPPWMLAVGNRALVQSPNIVAAPGQGPSGIGDGFQAGLPTGVAFGPAPARRPVSIGSRIRPSARNYGIRRLHPPERARYPARRGPEEGRISRLLVGRFARSPGKTTKGLLREIHFPQQPLCPVTCLPYSYSTSFTVSIEYNAIPSSRVSVELPH